MANTRARRLTSFTNDVSVNVLANILAAAVIYLGGVALGLLPGSRGAIITSLMVFGFGVTVLWGVLDDLMAGSSFREAISGSVLGLACILIGGGFFIHGVTVSFGSGGWLYAAFGAYSFIAGVVQVVQGYSHGRLERKKSQRISGLQWIEPASAARRPQ